jgi:DNA-binding MarR family transcriptional regulator
MHTTAGPTAGSPRHERPRVTGGPRSEGPISTSARVVLDRVLELLGRRRLSATELRVLLRLLDREASLSELAKALGQRPVEIRRAGRSLAMHGLVRRRHVGRRKQTRLEITAAGLATTRALLTAAGGGGTAGGGDPMSPSVLWVETNGGPPRR